MRLKNLFSLALDFSARMEEDHVSAYGAMASFFTLLSIFPLFSLFVMITKELPIIKTYAFNIMSNALPLGQNNHIILDILEQIYDAPLPGILSFTIVSILWSSSKWMFAIIQGLDCIYAVPKKKGYILLRLFSILYTAVFVIMLALLMIVFVFGNQIQKLIVAHFPFLAPISHFIFDHREFLAFFILTAFFIVLYKQVPNRKSTFKRELPGAIFTSCSWILVSSAFSIYVDYFPKKAYAYGSINAIILFFLWLYMTMYLLLLGAEVNQFIQCHKWRNIVRQLFPNWKKFQ
ncbi:MAG: YihY/virulence factor BrkB family protein [Lachnospiraceae bacterium]